MNRALRMSAILTALVVAMVIPVLAQDTPNIDPSQLVGPPQGQPLGGETLYGMTEKVASQMRCPVCQGLSVASSQTATAVAMKSEVRQMLEAGYTEAQVLQYFEESYGEFIRLAPKAEGFNLVVWLAPLAALLLGLGLVVQRMRRPATSAAAVSGEAAEEFDLAAYRERVSREVGS